MERVGKSLLKGFIFSLILGLFFVNPQASAGEWDVRLDIWLRLGEGCFFQCPCYPWYICPPPPPTYFGSLDIHSRPPGARVYLNGRYVGRTPLIIHRISPGYYWIEMVACGYRRWEEEVYVHPDRVTVVDATLRPLRYTYPHWHYPPWGWGKESRLFKKD